ncbi:tetratricopeptide repeat-containing sensor histidine kinase, partial [Cesiribacter sp. SM1]|uniref:tetratricopeptide repeat-containing sensor histidine kinase n=1 Tax=Cesiribacter sp. SM1 TaxID=2861196 RepID=UPI001CD60785
MNYLIYRSGIKNFGLRLSLLSIFFVMAYSPAVSAQTQLQDSSRVLELAALGDAHFDKDQLDSATLYYKQAEKLARKIGYTRGIVQYMRDYILVLNRKGQYKEALTLAEEALELSRQLGQADVSVAYNNIGLEYNFLANYEAAAANYLKALEISEALGNKSFQCKQSNNLASLYLNMRNKEKGMEYATKSYKLAQELQDTSRMASSLVNLANSQTLHKNYDLASTHFAEVLKLGKVLKDPSYALDAYINLADIQVQQANFKEALPYYYKALDALKSYQAPDYELYIYWGLAQNLYYLENYTDSYQYLQKGIAIGKSIEALNELRQLYLLGSELHEKIDKPQVALDYRKQYEALNDSILNAETQQNIQRLEVEYKTTQKEKEIAQQNLIIANNSLEIQKKNNVIYLTLAAVVTLFSALLIIYILFRNKQKANAEKLAALKREGEMKVLMALMEGEEKERSRLARELHDGVGGILSATKMHLSILKSEEAVPERFQKFDHTVSMLDSATHEIRTIAHN